MAVRFLSSLFLLWIAPLLAWADEKSSMSKMAAFTSSPQLKVDSSEFGVAGPDLRTVSNPTQIRIEESVSEKARKLLEYDLNQLADGALRVKRMRDSLPLRKSMGLRSTSGSALLHWLEERVSYVVGTFDPSAAIHVDTKDWLFQNAGVLPQGKLEHQLGNIGARYYLDGKRAGNLYALELGSFGSVRLTSPRIGIIEIGEDADLRPWSPAASIHRLSTLFHEARHSDGNGMSLAFTHAICPAGHDLEGEPVCDRNLNGPYTIGAEVIRGLADSCAACTDSEQEMLDLIELDSRGRVIQATGADESESLDREWDPTPEGEI